jgi:hypothetical protein
MDPEQEPQRARAVWESHLDRAKWMTTHGYKDLLGRQFTVQPLAQIDLKDPLSSNQGLHSLKDQVVNSRIPAPVSIKADTQRPLVAARSIISTKQHNNINRSEYNPRMGGR